MSLRRVAMLAFAALLLAGCGSGPVRRVSEPAASIQQLTVRADGRWDVQLRLQNYSTVAMRFTATDIEIAFDNGSAARVQAQPQLVVGPESADVYTATLQPTAAGRARLATALDAFNVCAHYIATNYASDPLTVHAASVPFLHLSGIVCGGWQLARAAAAARRRLDAGEGDAAFNTAKLKTARFYADHLLTRVTGLREVVLAGASAVIDFPEASF